MSSERNLAPAPRDRRAAAIAVAPLDSAGLDEAALRIGWAFLEDVIGELARFPSLEVLAGRTSFALSGHDLEPSRLAHRFGVTHLLDAAIRPSGRDARIRASLLETAGGRQLWTETYEVELRNLEAASATIAAQVANQLTSRIDGARLAQAKARPIGSLEAYDLWLRGRDVLRRGTVESDHEARELFERALTLDPTYSRAYAGLSLSHFNDWSCQRWASWEEGERLAYEYARRAVDLDDTDHLAHAVLGRIEIYRRNFNQGRRHLDRVATLSPNNADALMHTALWWAFLGEDDRAARQAETAFRLNPLHDGWYYLNAGLVAFIGDRMDEAVQMMEAAAPHTVIDQSGFMAAAYAHLDRLDEARVQYAAFLEIFREKITMGRAPRPGEPLDYLLHVNPFTRPEDGERLVEGLRRAGLTGERRGGVYRHDDGAEVARFARRGGLWEVEFAGRRAVIADVKGCRDLALLLASPQERIHCMELAGRVVEGDAGDALDARARAACQRRILDLQADLAEAERDNDLARTERLAAELDAVIDQLSAAVGLGGRSRRLGDPAEKARTAVTWRIRSAIRQIAKAHDTLGRHLQTSVRTGAFCVYQPERPVRWAVN